ncbi:MAG: hypothetical protein JW993_07580 [Sedimentisphaerales bacterium]|nr:hypothetical protein [Sedimentisphaerales bacterium]
MKRLRSIVTDEEADATLQTLVTGPVVYATDTSPGEKPTASAPGPSCGHPAAEVLTPAALRLLAAVVKNPMRRSSEYAKLAGMSPNTVGRVRPALIARGLIREHQLESGRRGRAAILLEPLEAAARVLAQTEVSSL